MDELFALAQDIRNGIESKPKEMDLAKSTQDRWKCIASWWRECMNEFRFQPVGDTLFESPPSTDMIQLFLRWLLLKRKGMLDSKLTLTTFWNIWNRFQSLVHLETGRQYSKQDKLIMSRFINTTLVDAGASTKCRDKPIVTISVVRELLEFLWARDEYELAHPRMRIQLAFIMLVAIYWGVRPGEIVESGMCRGTNEGITYGDIEINRIPDEDSPNAMIYVLLLKLRFRKGRRRNEKRIQRVILREMTSDRSLCPVTHFMALAIADEALEGVDKPSRLHELRIQNSRNAQSIRIKPSMKDVPILRASNSKGAISNVEILTTDNALVMLKGLGQRAGYKENISLYAFRRGFANSIDPQVTTAQRQQVMGHSNALTFQEYISNIVGLDTQALVTGTRPKTGLVELVRSADLHRDTRAPVPYGSRLTNTKDLATQFLQFSSDFSMTQIKERKRVVQRKQYKDNAREFFDHVSSSDISNQISGKNDEPVLYGPSRYLRALLRYDSDRREVIENFYKKRELPLMDTLEPLIRMACPSSTSFYYQDANVDDSNCCPDCMKSFAKCTKPYLRNRHLLVCARKRKSIVLNWISNEMNKKVTVCRWGFCHSSLSSRTPAAKARHLELHIKGSITFRCFWNGCGDQTRNTEELGLHLLSKHKMQARSTECSNIEYCYECREWKAHGEYWESHCKEHLQQIPLFCGIIQRGGVVIVAGRCLFCISDKSLTYSHRLHQYNSTYLLRAHLKSHIMIRQDPYKCPHPACAVEIDGENSFWVHALKDHGISGVFEKSNEKGEGEQGEGEQGEGEQGEGE